MSLNSSDEYLTIRGLARSRITVKGSIFIATALPVNSEEDATDRIQRISLEFQDATHNCFAYRIKVASGESYKFSDAGEPRGTAGKPILSAIEAEKLYNVLVVVSRYFGGTKLGTGGLYRAYRQSAHSVIQKAKKVTEWLTTEIDISYPLNASGRINQILAKYDIRVKERGFEKEAMAKIVVRRGILEEIKRAFLEATHGQVRFK